MGDGSGRGNGGTLRVVVQQPALPRYRIPVFRELAAREGIGLRVVYGSQSELENVGSEGFEAERAAATRGLVGGLGWSGAQVRLAGERGIDTLVLEWNARLLSLPIALVRARLRGIRTVVWGHGYSKREGRARAWIRRWIGRMADGAMFYDARTAERYVEVYGFARERVFVAANALDQGPIRAAREACLADAEGLARFREARGIAGPLVLFVSRLLAENRVDLLIEGLPRLRERVPGAMVGIVGAGPDEDRLRALVAEFGVEDAVVFAGAVYGEEELARWFCSAGVFCYPENIGLSVLHAFGYGVPVVTSDRVESQNPEIVALEDGVNGALYRHGDVGAMVGALAEILGDGGRRASMSAAALETVAEGFALDRMVDGMERAVRGVEVRAG